MIYSLKNVSLTCLSIELGFPKTYQRHGAFARDPVGTLAVVEFFGVRDLNHARRSDGPFQPAQAPLHGVLWRAYRREWAVDWTPPFGSKWRRPGLYPYWGPRGLGSGPVYGEAPSSRRVISPPAGGINSNLHPYRPSVGWSPK